MAAVSVQLKTRGMPAVVRADGSVLFQMQKHGVRLHQPAGAGADREWLVRPGTKIQSLIEHRKHLASPSVFCCLLQRGGWSETVAVWDADFGKPLQAAPSVQLDRGCNWLVSPLATPERPRLATSFIAGLSPNWQWLFVINPYKREFRRLSLQASEKGAEKTKCHIVRCSAGAESPTERSFPVMALTVTDGVPEIRIAAVHCYTGDLLGQHVIAVPHGVPQACAFCPAQSPDSAAAVCVWKHGAERAVVGVTADEQKQAPAWDKVDLGDLRPTDTTGGLDNRVVVAAADPETLVVGVLQHDEAAIAAAEAAAAKKGEGEGKVKHPVNVRFAICDARYGTLVETLDLRVCSAPSRRTELFHVALGGQPAALWVGYAQHAVCHRSAFARRTLAGAISASRGESGAAAKGAALDVSDLLIGELEGAALAGQWAERAKKAAKQTPPSGSAEGIAAAFRKCGRKRPRQPAEAGGTMGEEAVRRALESAVQHKWWTAVEAAIEAAAPLPGVTERQSNGGGLALHYALAPQLIPALRAAGDDGLRLLPLLLQRMRGVPAGQYVLALETFLTPVHAASKEELSTKVLRRLYGLCDTCLRGAVTAPAEVAIALSGRPPRVAEAVQQYLLSRITLRVVHPDQERLTRLGVPTVEELCLWQAALANGCAEHAGPRLRKSLAEAYVACTHAATLGAAALGIEGLLSAYVGTPGSRSAAAREVESKELQAGPLTACGVHHVCTDHELLL
eukprot:TRINITY_DN46935_c0_g1_i1.p1 TRINITY_DN46935_c0_g1~~TRINITY_DN46935_c0_g1_i1.p1  ORF type:complete len:762 (+),score=210.81 TRINITY_DN46935_c0_g1_i1:79-2286(+)